MACIALLAGAGLASSLPGSAGARAESATALYSFKGGADGRNPLYLNKDNDGNLIGTTRTGNIVFKVTLAGVETVLHNIKGSEALVIGPLTTDARGFIYGSGTYGGSPSCGCGTVFKMAPNGNLRTLFQFPGGAKGAYPKGRVALDKDGAIYGMAFADVPGSFRYKQSVVFRIETDGTERIIHTFGQPFLSDLTIDAAGNLYGVRQEAGRYGRGMIFKVWRDGRVTALYSFTGGDDGSGPTGGVILDADGNLYGTANTDGSGGLGTIFKLTPAGQLIVLHAFRRSRNEGAYPNGNLTRDTQGNLYGVTPSFGVAYKVTPGGRFSVLHRFSENDPAGSFPFGPLVLDTAGNIYGTAFEGGAHGFGTIFKITP